MSLRLERGRAMQVVENQFLKFCFTRGQINKRKLIQPIRRNSWLNELLGLRIRITLHFMKDVNVLIHFM